VLKYSVTTQLIYSNENGAPFIGEST